MFETSLKASFLTAAQRTGRGGFVWWLHRDTPAEHTAAVLVSAWSQFGTAHLRCSCWRFKRITSFKQVKEAAPHLYSAVDFPRQCSNRDVENTDRERERARSRNVTGNECLFWRLEACFNSSRSHGRRCCREHSDTGWPLWVQAAVVRVGFSGN